MSQPTSAQLASKEGQMALAINSYNSGYFTSIRSAADTYDVPESTLQTRQKGRPSRQAYSSINHNLTNTEELILVNWILSMDERGLPARTAARSAVSCRRYVAIGMAGGIVLSDARDDRPGREAAVQLAAPDQGSLGRIIRPGDRSIRQIGE